MKTVEHHDVREDPRRMTGVQLARLGIQIQNRFDLVLQCVTCRETWSPRLDANGKLSAGYWICPNKCNV